MEGLTCLLHLNLKSVINVTHDFFSHPIIIFLSYIEKLKLFDFKLISHKIESLHL